MAATGFFQPPQPMEPRTSSPAVTWKKWRQRFEIYMTAAGKTEANVDMKTSLLLHAIGPEGIEIFNAFTLTEEEEGTKYMSTLSKFQAYFVPKVNLTYERHRNRQVGESIDNITSCPSLSQILHTPLVSSCRLLLSRLLTPSYTPRFQATITSTLDRHTHTHTHTHTHSAVRVLNAGVA